MQRLASMSVVLKADGGISEALYNGQRDRVVEAIRAEERERVRAAEQETERARRRADALAEKCKRAQDQNIELLKNMVARRSLTAEYVQRTWACLYMTMYAIGHVVHCAWNWSCAMIEAVYVAAYVYIIAGGWLDVGEVLGLWEYEG